MKKTIGLPVALAAVMAVVLMFALSSIALAQTPAPAGPTRSVQATESPPATLTVLGQITNGTPGASLPVTMTVTLLAADGQSMAYNRQATADASGNVRFVEVPYKAGRAYALVVVRDTVQYHSKVVVPRDGEKTLTLPVQIYEAAADTSRVGVDEMYVVGQFLSEQELQVVNAYVLSNNGDRAVQGGEKTADGRQATLRFYLPPGAGNVEFQGDDGQKYARTGDGYVTTWGIPPGKNATQVVVRYTLPYTGQLHLETRVQYPVQKVNVLMANQGITLTSASLVDQGTQAGQDGTVRRAYSQNGLAAGERLAFDLTGAPQLTAPAAPQEADASGAGSAEPASATLDLTTLDLKKVDRRVVGAGVVGAGAILILAAGIWRFASLRRRDQDVTGDHRVLYEALADLDEEHEAGKIGDADYAGQRALLKAALLAALQDPVEALAVAPQ